MVGKEMDEESGRAMSSEYMPWAKSRSHARYNLATSGMANLSIAELPVNLDDLELSGPSSYGYEPLQQALAARCAVGPECVVAANGTSMANHLAMAAMIEPGSEVLIEFPTYELILSTARYLGAQVKRFPRAIEAGFALDASAIERVVTPRTRLIVLTNLHNPSSAVTGEETMREVGHIARKVGSKVLVDEVYLDAAFDAAPRSAFHLGEECVVTSSLTKVYGLSGLRCGWILAEPELARRMWRLNDLFGVIPAHCAERLSVIALAHLDRIAAKSRTRLDANRIALNRFLDSCEGLIAPRLEWGTTAFPRLVRGSVEDLCSLLREKYETTVVPGKYFEMPDHFRIGLGGEAGMLIEGLARLGAAIAELSG
jgi:aspartate/methionine/tyrosine aminotransferase